MQFQLKGMCPFLHVFFHSQLIDLDPEDNFNRQLLLTFGGGCDTGDEAVMKIHKKIKIDIVEIGTFSAVPS